MVKIIGVCTLKYQERGGQGSEIRREEVSVKQDMGFARPSAVEQEMPVSPKSQSFF
jgi:hypothetical protein